MTSVGSRLGSLLCEQAITFDKPIISIRKAHLMCRTLAEIRNLTVFQSQNPSSFAYFEELLVRALIYLLRKRHLKMSQVNPRAFIYLAPASLYSFGPFPLFTMFLV